MNDNEKKNIHQLYRFAGPNAPVKKALFALPMGRPSHIAQSRRLSREERPRPTEIVNRPGAGLLRRKNRPDEIDLNALIDTTVRRFTDYSFIYLTYTVPTQSEHFNAYALAEVPFTAVDKQRFYTVSRRGVTFFGGRENHFTPLAAWQTEYHQFRKLMQIPTFASFRLWKGFTLWRKGIVWRRFAARSAFLHDNLFAAIGPLAKATLTLRREYCAFGGMTFVQVAAPSLRENQHLFYFVEAQMLTYERARDALVEYRKRMTGVLCELLVVINLVIGYMKGVLSV